MLSHAISVIKNELLRVHSLERATLYLKLGEFWDDNHPDAERVIGEALAYLQNQGVVRFGARDDFHFQPSPQGVAIIELNIEFIDTESLSRLIPPAQGPRTLAYDVQNHVLSYAGHSILISGARQRVFLEVMFQHDIGQEVSWDEIWGEITGDQNPGLDVDAQEKIRSAYKGINSKLKSHFQLSDGFRRGKLTYIRVR